MNSAPRVARRRGGRDGGRTVFGRVVLVLGGFALAVVVFAKLGPGGNFDARAGGPPPQTTATADAPIIFSGLGSRTTDPFYLAGGTYHSEWSAWGVAAEYPPCTHSVELMAGDPGDAETSLGHVSDLAKFAHVPATGASSTSYLYNLNAGDYFPNVASECGWQVALSPS